MAAATAAWILDALPGLEFGSTAQEAGNRISLDGLALGPLRDGTRTVTARRLEAGALRLVAGPLVLEVGRLTLHQLAARLHFGAGAPRLQGLEAADAELTGVKMEAAWTPAPRPRDQHAHHLPGSAAGAHAAGAPAAVEPAASGWSLGPLADAEGTVRARITDAHLLFDADVTVPIRQGQVDFNAASVEHVGPDSRMGVSRMGVYVDAPNGRSYLYQFPATPVGGVEYERRGALPGPFVADRGRLRLQAFAEGLLRQARAGEALGVTEQARLLFGRTALTGEVQLGDAPLAVPGVQVEFAGRAQGRNHVRIHSEALGRGVTLDIAALSLARVALHVAGMELHGGAITGALLLRVFLGQPQLRFAFELPGLKVSQLRLQPHRPPI